MFFVGLALVFGVKQKLQKTPQSFNGTPGCVSQKVCLKGTSLVKGEMTKDWGA